MKAMRSGLSLAPSHSNRLKPLARPRWLPERVWPFEAFGLEVDGKTIAVTDVGDGPALLFIHIGLWSFVWRDVVERLSRDFRCIAFDAPGTGLSERLPGPEITLARAASVVPKLIALDISNLCLVFHDLGGPTGIAGASRVSRRIRGLAAVNTFGWKPSGALFRAMLAVMGSAVVREFDASTGLLARISASNFGVGLHMDDESRAAFRSGIGPDGLRTFHRYMHQARTSDSIYQETESALRGPFRTLLLLTIFGERNDPLRFQPRWKQMFPDGQQVVIPKGNHFPMCDDPDFVADTIRTWHRERVSHS